MTKHFLFKIMMATMVSITFGTVANTHHHIARADGSVTNSDDNDDSQDDSDTSDTTTNPPKTVTVNFKSTTGVTLGNSQVVTVNDGEDFNDPDKVFNGYLELIDSKQQLNYNNLPQTTTINYIKISPLVKQLNQAYMKLVNQARKKAHLKPFLSSSDLQKRVNVRAQEQFQKEGHIRPNGTSYNTKNSGYAEVYSPFFLQIKPGATGVDVKPSANWVLNRLLTEDSIHRDTVLNKWARYSNAAFGIDPEKGFFMVQLFHISK